MDTLKSRAIQQYGDWYTGCWWVCCYIWYNDEGTEWGHSPPRDLLAVPNGTGLLPTASVPTSYYFMWRYNCLCVL